MTALKVTLDTSLDRFVEDQVRSGAYPDAETVVRAGLALLQADEADKTARYQRLLQDGLDDVEAGRVEEVEDIPAWLNALGPRPSK